mgnify:CR=1 FL=1
MHTTILMTGTRSSIPGIFETISWGDIFAWNPCDLLIAAQGKRFSVSESLIYNSAWMDEQNQFRLEQERLCMARQDEFSYRAEEHRKQYQEGLRMQEEDRICHWIRNQDRARCQREIDAMIIEDDLANRMREVEKAKLAQEQER